MAIRGVSWYEDGLYLLHSESFFAASKETVKRSDKERERC